MPATWGPRSDRPHGKVRSARDQGSRLESAEALASAIRGTVLRTCACRGRAWHAQQYRERQSALPQHLQDRRAARPRDCAPLQWSETLARANDAGPDLLGGVADG